MTIKQRAYQLIAGPLRQHIDKKLKDSGTIEYRCPSNDCQTQIFSTYPIRLACIHCGIEIKSLHEIKKLKIVHDETIIR